MKQYEPERRDGSLYLVCEDDALEVGDVDEIINVIGGETYEIEYDEEQRAQPWLDTEDGVLEIDTRDAVTTMTHTPDFVSDLKEYDMSTDRYGVPTRTVQFAHGMIDILEQQGAGD
jgi:hypothetical protein